MSEAEKRPLTDILMRRGFVECAECRCVVWRSKLATERHRKRCGK